MNLLVSRAVFLILNQQIPDTHIRQGRNISEIFVLLVNLPDTGTGFFVVDSGAFKLSFQLLLVHLYLLSNSTKFSYLVSLAFVELRFE